MLVALTHCDSCTKEESRDQEGWFVARVRKDPYGNPYLGIKRFDATKTPNENDRHLCSLECLLQYIRVEFGTPVKTKKRSAKADG